MHVHSRAKRISRLATGTFYVPRLRRVILARVQPQLPAQQVAATQSLLVLQQVQEVDARSGCIVACHFTPRFVELIMKSTDKQRMKDLVRGSTMAREFSRAFLEQRARSSVFAVDLVTFARYTKDCTS